MRMAATAAVYNRLHNSSVGVVGGGGSGGMAHHSQLARSLERILEEAHLSGELILTNRKLKDFPKTGTKFHLADTVIADLSRNRFCELPEEITSFSFLETLLLYHNTIRSIPESVKHLTSLTYLDLRSNQLSALPREICFLPLQVLLVSNNRLTSLPDELGRMDRLTDLDASYNQLTTLPARIGELRSLRSFSLRSNQLMYLPRELTCLTLISLDVSNNRIASLPLEIRQMSTLVEFNLENNPLTSPPASLCIRGLVHVFKFLETQATKDEKGSRAGGNYDGYTTLRRAPRYNANGNMLESNRVPRHPVDTGYSTCDGIDKRWSHDMPYAKSKCDSPARRTPTTPPCSLSSEMMDASLTSSTSTIVDESLSMSSAAAVVKPLNSGSQSDASPAKRQMVVISAPTQSPPPPPPTATLHQHINYAHSSSSNGSSPDQEDLLLDQQQQSTQNGRDVEKHNKNLGNIQTYREYKEALKQQRNLEISSVYKIKGQKTLYDMSEASLALNSNTIPVQEEVLEVSCNGGTPTHNATLPKSIMKNATNGLNGTANGGINGTAAVDDSVVIPKKPIQKVIPSRNTELMSLSQAAKVSAHELDSRTMAHANGDCLGYVKPNSPMRLANGGIGGGGILSNNNKFATISGGSGGLRSPLNSADSKLSTAKTHRSVTWNHDIPPEKLSFTMRREFDRQREETELMTQLRSIIETRLKMTLPEDIASALTDGVILCHLANYVRPRSVASIHVPSPGVSKLTMARCRRNVDNFLEACRKIGVDEELICSCADVVPPSSSDNDDVCHSSNSHNNSFNNNNCYDNDNTRQHQQLAEEQQQQQQFDNDSKRQTLPNPSAVLKTVSALMAMDCNPHHQNIRNMQQQHELHLKLQLQHRQHKQQSSQVQDEQEQHVASCLQEQEAAQHSQSVANQEQLQQPATRTKEQMKQQQHELVADMEFENSGLKFNAKCHFESVLTSSSSINDADDVVDACVQDDNDYRNGDNECMLQARQRQPKQQTTCNTVGNFLRHAKMKTFQKMKLHLTAQNGSNNNNHHGSTLATTTLQTIVETETDVVGGVAAGVYQLINEKPLNADDVAEAAAAVTTAATAAGEKSSGNQYKLLELPKLTTKQQQQPVKTTPSNTVSKRIEFFEHSTSIATPKAAQASSSGGGSTPIIATVKPKVKNNIFSIYRVADVADEKSLKSCASDEQQAGSVLLKHDSHVLTVILSCVFIVTFLLLVFFPLPG